MSIGESIVPNTFTVSRTFMLDRQIRSQLVELGSTKVNLYDPQEVCKLLPPSLSIDEISNVGIQICSRAELGNPSRGGIAHGKKVECRAVARIGEAALLNGDSVTASNAIEYLDSYGNFGIRGILMAALLKRTKKHLVTEANAPEVQN